MQQNPAAIPPEYQRSAILSKLTKYGMDWKKLTENEKSMLLMVAVEGSNWAMVRAVRAV